MAKEKVAFLGPPSSYSHQATIVCFPASDYEHLPVVTIRDIFEAVQSGGVSQGVVPFENSTNGSVVFTLDLFADRSNLYPDIFVCGEAYLNVQHFLLGNKVQSDPSSQSAETSRPSTPTPNIPNPLKPRTKPLSSLRAVERIYSHPQAFGQCEIFLGAYLKGIERVDVSSTSKAAKLVKEDNTGKSVAIASEVASDIHNLVVLARGIEDREDNTTRFFILKRGPGGLYGRAMVSGKDRAAATKTLVSFTVDHRSPGALANVLDCFRKYKLNLTSINSRPSRVVPFQYIFFVEFEGSKIDDPNEIVKGALESVEEVAKSCRWLGSWEDKLQR